MTTRPTLAAAAHGRREAVRLALGSGLTLAAALAPFAPPRGAVAQTTATAGRSPDDAPQTAAAGGREILRVTGRIGEARRAEGVGFTLAALEALGVEEMVTETPWTRGPQRFSGVPVTRLLAAVEAEGGATTLRARALDDYMVSLPVSDARDNGLFLAMREGGTPLRVRDRGPLWLVYPWTRRPDLRVPEFTSRAVWQLRRLDVA